MKILAKAKDFYLKNKEKKAVRDTFGYFTDHPVAKLNQNRLKLILKEIESRHPKRVLDLACGAGLITSAISEICPMTLGIDINDSEISMARSFSVENGFTSRFLQADLLKNGGDENWKVQVEQILGGRPDCVILAYALHHFPDVPNLLQQLDSWLPKETILIINEENPRSPLFKLKHWVRTVVQRDTDIEWHQTYKEWSELLEVHHFYPQAPQGLDFIPGLGKVFSRLCWSLVFVATRR